MRSDRGYHQGKAQSRNENTGGIAGRSAKQEASGHLKKNTGSKETAGLCHPVWLGMWSPAEGSAQSTAPRGSPVTRGTEVCLPLLSGSAAGDEGSGQRN